MLKEPVYCVDSWILDVFRDVREASFCESLNYWTFFIPFSFKNIYIYFNLVVYDIFFYINSKFFFFFYFMLERNNINN